MKKQELIIENYELKKEIERLGRRLEPLCSSTMAEVHQTNVDSIVELEDRNVAKSYENAKLKGWIDRLLEAGDELHSWHYREMFSLDDKNECATATKKWRDISSMVKAMKEKEEKK